MNCAARRSASSSAMGALSALTRPSSNIGSRPRRSRRHLREAAVRIMEGIEGSAEQHRTGEATARGLGTVGGAQKPVEVPAHDPREQRARFMPVLQAIARTERQGQLCALRVRHSPAHAPREGRRDAPPLPASARLSRDADRRSILPTRRRARGGSGDRRDAGGRFQSLPSSRARSAPPAARPERGPEPGRCLRATGRHPRARAAGVLRRALARARLERSDRSPPAPCATSRHARAAKRAPAPPRLRTRSPPAAARHGWRR